MRNEAAKMKNYIKAISLIMLIAMLAATLAACKEDALKGMTDREKAQFIIEKTAALHSENSVQTSDFSQAVEGTINAVKTKTEISGTSKRIVLDATKDTMRTVNVQSIKSSVMAGGATVTKNYVSTSGYADGYMFTGYDSDNADDPDIFLKSKLNYSEYMPYLKNSDQETGDLDYTSLCENVSVKLSEDKKSYVINFEHSASGEGTEIEDMANVFTKSFGVRFKLVSFELECIADRETYVISEATVKIVTESDKFGEDVLKFVYTAKTVSSTPEEGCSVIPSDYDSYTETDDIRYSAILAAQLNNITSSNNIHFFFSTSKNITANSTTISSYSERETVNCGIKNDTYVQYITASAYPMQAVVADSYVITFNGTMQAVTEKKTGKKTENPMTELGARMYLSSILSNLLFSPEEVTALKVYEPVNGETCVKMDLVVNDTNKQILESFGLNSEVQNAFFNLTAFFDADMNVISAQTYLLGQIKLEGQTYTIRVENKISNLEDADVSKVPMPRPKNS